ncbi:MerR family transcriptional regulator [Actinotalea sp. M2MS4P-6]|uniref:MerR family transcriptional regulator n=1 Tax=Actinotalea sp. M2MS4P-6 TaxID=2983762 RepID=UPI0021E4CA0E|nr:MerR family transcriptional regulator [Actinotalea sp. M2MS4P-6]MCV2395390.1 MerR family transcriptional regulator [Actinotalea sp. M2MS4P-6]
MTVGRLAARFGLSRTTLLYYDRLGLLQPSSRSAGGYRIYDDADVARLATICRLRQAGLPLAEIRRAMDSDAPQLVAALAVRLGELEDQIEVLRGRQRAILTSLATGREGDRTWSLDKASLSGLLVDAGADPAGLVAWHAAAENADGELHRRLLESLDLPADEVERIRGLGSQSSGATT